MRLLKNILLRQRAPLTTAIRYYSNNGQPKKADFSDIPKDIPKTYLVPPFTENLHQLAKEIGPISEQWCHKLGLFVTEKSYKSYMKSDFGQFTARVFPFAENDRIDVLMDYMSWLYLFDDALEEGANYGTDVYMAKKYVHKLMDIMNPSKAPAATSPYEKAFLNIWQRLADLTSPAWQNRFRLHMLDYLQAVVHENKNREKKHVPTLGTYIALRPSAGCVVPCLDLIQAGSNIDLPDRIVNNDILKYMSLVANYIICFSNDLNSWQREAKDTDFHNLVSVLKHDKNLTWQNAVLEAKKIYDFQVQLFIELEKLLPEFEDKKIDHEVHRMVEGLKAWIRGNIDFMQMDRSSVRYQG